MFTTGNIVTDLLIYLTLAIPLMPVVFMLYKKEYNIASFMPVIVLCLFYFFQRLLAQFTSLLDFSPSILYTLFHAFEFTLLAGIFRTNFKTKCFHVILNIFLIAYLFSTIIYFAFEGFNDNLYILKMIQNALTILLMATTIYLQMNKQQSMLMNTPLYWISLSTIFYFAFCSFWESGKEFIFIDNDQSEIMTQNFFLVAVVIRFSIISVAVYFLEPYREKVPECSAEFEIIFPKEDSH